MLIAYCVFICHPALPSTTKGLWDLSCPCHCHTCHIFRITSHPCLSLHPCSSLILPRLPPSPPFSSSPLPLPPLSDGVVRYWEASDDVLRDLAGEEPAMQTGMRGGAGTAAAAADVNGSPEKHPAPTHITPHQKWPKSPSFKLQVRMGWDGMG